MYCIYTFITIHMPYEYLGNIYSFKCKGKGRSFEKPVSHLEEEDVLRSLIGQFLWLLTAAAKSLHCSLLFCLSPPVAQLVGL